MRGVLYRALGMTGVVSTAPKRSEERAEGESGRAGEVREQLARRSHPEASIVP